MYKIKHYQLIINLILLLLPAVIKAQIIQPVPQAKQVSIRGLSVVNEQVAWLSGTKGSIAKTINGGKTWDWQQVKGFEKADFRDIEAFSDKNAIIMSSGTPALILKTTDGGVSWQLKYQNDDKAFFFDAMDFAGPKLGFILGDPIAGKFLLLQTTDAGENWETVKNTPAALKDEAAFAASGTCLRIDKDIHIVTGGGYSRLLTSPVKKMAWAATPLPLTNGSASSGAFSYAHGKNQDVIVGGNYAVINKTDSLVYIVPNVKTVSNEVSPIKGPSGFQSSVTYIKGDTYISTGTSGSNITLDGGKTWVKIDGVSYNVCQKAKNGKLILFAGDDGHVGIYKP